MQNINYNARYFQEFHWNPQLIIVPVDDSSPLAYRNKVRTNLKPSTYTADQYRYAGSPDAKKWENYALSQYLNSVIKNYDNFVQRQTQDRNILSVEEKIDINLISNEIEDFRYDFNVMKNAAIDVIVAMDPTYEVGREIEKLEDKFEDFYDAWQYLVGFIIDGDQLDLHDEAFDSDEIEDYLYDADVSNNNSGAVSSDNDFLTKKNQEFLVNRELCAIPTFGLLSPSFKEGFKLSLAVPQEENNYIIKSHTHDDCLNTTLPGIIEVADCIATSEVELELCSDSKSTPITGVEISLPKGKEKKTVRFDSNLNFNDEVKSPGSKKPGIVFPWKDTILSWFYERLSSRPGSELQAIASKAFANRNNIIIPKHLCKSKVFVIH